MIDSPIKALVITEDMQDEILNYVWAHPGCTLAGEIFDQFGETQEVAQTVAYLLLNHLLDRGSGGCLSINLMVSAGS